MRKPKKYWFVFFNSYQEEDFYTIAARNKRHARQKFKQRRNRRALVDVCGPIEKPLPEYLEAASRRSGYYRSKRAKAKYL